MLWGIVAVGSIAALTQAFLFYRSMLQADAGTPAMVRIAGYVREGAKAYLTQQYKIVGVYFVLVALLLAFSVYIGIQSFYVPIAFLTGGFWSGVAGFVGMRTATQASSRTAAGAAKSLNEGLQVAFRSGAVMGLTVVGLGLFDISFWFAFLRWVAHLSLDEITVTMLCSLMGASSQALFARVGGGIFTKAADVGADLVGKVEHSIPEDDPRNPATIADNVGDNVGDVAGMGADLYESYCGSILASAALGVAAFSPELLALEGIDASEAAVFRLRAMFLPLILAAMGVLVSIGAIYLVRTNEDTSQAALLKVLGKGIGAATLGVFLVAFAATYLLLQWTFLGIAGSIVVGLVAGWVIGKWTEYATSDEYAPTKDLANQAATGPATVIIAGVADGMKSVWAPILVICIGTLVAFGLATGWRFQEVEYFSLGLYGVGIAAVGMLSTLGITLATDAYGPIADNAGGNAQMAGLEPIVRERTDALDSLGNTTAATGKGFAIGSAALTALALLAAYVEQVRTGFDRWVQDKTLVVAEGEALKVSPGFVVFEAADKTRHGFLAMPDDRRDERVRDAWAKLDASSGPQVVPEELVKVSTDLNGRPEQATFVASGVKLISLRKATLLDFARYYDASLLNPKVIIGIFLGCMATFVFCAQTMKAVGRAAKGMVEEVRSQFAAKPGIMTGEDQPDYARPVAISTVAAQREMIFPSLLGILTPLIVGGLLGVAGVMGLLVGVLACGFCVAIFMANSGGAWDNAKKYIEAGHLGGKGSDAHKAAVVGDTVGDPFKDTSGPSLNILIKLMSMVSVVGAGFVVRYSLQALGIF
ncbi:MAG: sodium-translocating pyrophosphatase [Planctomycetales bacterium]|nr:sodium-translocating pyrophosphatase [Planctomycetales bacterium]